MYVQHFYTVDIFHMRMRAYEYKYLVGCSVKNGTIASSELENYSDDSDDPHSLGPPAKRLAGVVLCDSISEGEETDMADDTFRMPVPIDVKEEGNKYDQSSIYVSIFYISIYIYII